MERPLVAAQAATEYLKELVESALVRQHLQARDMTAYYLVDLLCRFVRADGREFASDSEPMAVRLVRARESRGPRAACPAPGSRRLLALHDRVLS